MKKFEVRFEREERMRKIKGIEKNMMERMKEYKWKGNVSELKNDVYSEVMI